MPLSKQIIFDILDAIPQLWDTVELNTDIIIGSGYVPVKSRDEREPMRMQKIKVERKLRSLFQCRFKRQLEVLAMTGVQKAKPKPRIPIDLPDWEDEDYIDELVAIIYEASKYGIALFAEQVIIGLDYTLSSAEALAWAKKYSYELVKGIDETTRDIISNAISSFIETPGFTIRDIMDELTDFSEKRAATIAVTETTRAFAEGQKEAGEELRKEFPDMKIEKTWFTNNDDRVCDICGPLDGKSVAYEDEFDAEGPPAHVNCRCWIEFNTRSGDKSIHAKGWVTINGNHVLIGEEGDDYMSADKAGGIVNNLSSRFGTPAPKVRNDPNISSPANARGKDILINEDYINDWVDFNKDDSIASSKEELIVHEYGHVIERELMLNEKYVEFGMATPSVMREHGIPYEGSLQQDLYRIAKEEGSLISDYATTNDSEYFAEAFVLYNRGPENYDKINTRVLDIFKKLDKNGK